MLEIIFYRSGTGSRKRILVLTIEGQDVFGCEGPADLESNLMSAQADARGVRLQQWRISKRAKAGLLGGHFLTLMFWRRHVLQGLRADDGIVAKGLCVDGIVELVKAFLSSMESSQSAYMTLIQAAVAIPASVILQCLSLLSSRGRGK